MARFLRSGGIADRVERVLGFVHVLSQALGSYKLCRYQLKLVSIFDTAVACTPRPGLEHQAKDISFPFYWICDIAPRAVSGRHDSAHSNNRLKFDTTVDTG